MYSILNEAFASPEAAMTALERAFADYRYDSRSTRGQVELILPNRDPLPWRIRKRRFRLKLGRTPAQRSQYEPVVTAAFDFVIDNAPVRTIYDLGAASGYFCMIGATRKDREITVHGFDMRPESRDQIQKLAERLGNKHIHAYLSGMSDTCRGEQEVWYSIIKMFEQKPDPSSYRDSFWVQLKMRLRGKKDRDRLWKESVMIDSIDAFTERMDENPGLIKIDIEGYEAKALPGGMKAFASHRPVICLELHKTRFFAHHGVTRPEIVKPLFDLGYSCIFFSNHHRLEENRLRLIGPDDPALTNEATDSMMFI